MEDLNLASPIGSRTLPACQYRRTDIFLPKLLHDLFHSQYELTIKAINSKTIRRSEVILTSTRVVASYDILIILVDKHWRRTEDYEIKELNRFRRIVIRLLKDLHHPQPDFLQPNLDWRG